MAPSKIEVSFEPYFFHMQGKIYFKIIHFKCEVNQMAFMDLYVKKNRTYFNHESLEGQLKHCILFIEKSYCPLF